MKINYIRGYDGLRACSILFVLSDHLGSKGFFNFSGSAFAEMRLWPLVSGATGVNIFFTLSGFLITQILVKELEAKGNINYENFFARRFLRLSPPLVILCLVLALLMLFNYLPPHYISILFSFFYLNNFQPSKFFTPELGHTWSLAVEEQFYLTWPFFLKNFFHKKSVWVICFAFVVLSAAAACIFPGLYIPVEYRGNVYSLLNEVFTAGDWFIPAAAPIIIGSMAGLFLFKKTSFLRKSFAGNYKLLFLSFVIYGSSLFLPEFFQPVLFIIRSFGVATFLLWLYFNQRSGVVSILEWKPLNYIGKISYGLYIYQGLFLRSKPGGELFVQQFPQNILFAFMAAMISYHFIEKKFLKLKSRFQ
jgi:peptidoglycan/LPS O-acetylase OafA/YrhL